MGAKGTIFDNDFLKLIFNGIAIPNLADDAATLPLTDLYVSLHTANPGISGNQTTHEATYSGYARVAVPRSPSGWTITGSTVSPTATIVFPLATGGSETERYFVIGTDFSGTGKILYFGPISPPIIVATNIAPELTNGSVIEEG